MVGRQFLLGNIDLIGYTQKLVADKSLGLETLSSDSRMIGPSLRIPLNKQLIASCNWLKSEMQNMIGSEIKANAWGLNR